MPENGVETIEQTSEFEKLPNEVYEKALKEIIKEHYGKSSDDVTVSLDAASAKGDNYIGVLYRITLNNSENKKLSVVAKLPPQNQIRREQFFARPCFLRESEFYDTIFPMFTKFQQEKGIDPKTEGFYQVAECYKSMTDEPHEGLFFEDLKVSGFEMFDRLKDATFDHVKHVMETLGKFHAISFAIKDQKPELLEPYREMTDIFFQRDETSKDQIKVWFDVMKKQALDTIENHENEDLKKRATNVMELDFFDLLESCIEGKLAEPYTILQHGDCWNNNIMYRYENGIPVEVRLLDWQIMRYSSPVLDMLYYIFGCTTKELRDKHYNEFLDIYYQSLSTFMEKLGSNPAVMFPRDAFDDHLKRFGKFGLAMAIMVLPVFTSNVEDIPDMDEMAEKLQEALENGQEVPPEQMTFTSSKTQGAYEKRMIGVIQDVYDLGYI